MMLSKFFLRKRNAFINNGLRIEYNWFGALSPKKKGNKMQGWNTKLSDI